MSESMEKRESERVNRSIVTFVRKPLPNGSHHLMQFRSMDLSQGGVFISTDDLSILEIGENCEVLLEEKSEKLYQSQAKVVRGARVYTDEGEQTVSGYGLMFFDPEEDFLTMLHEQLAGEHPPA